MSMSQHGWITFEKRVNVYLDLLALGTLLLKVFGWMSTTTWMDIYIYKLQTRRSIRRRGDMCATTSGSASAFSFR